MKTGLLFKDLHMVFTYAPFLFSGINGTFVTCNRDYLKIGCFKNTKYLNTLLLNDRDPGSPTFSGFMIQWGNLGKSLHRFVCLFVFENLSCKATFAPHLSLNFSL